MLVIASVDKLSLNVNMFLVENVVIICMTCVMNVDKGNMSAYIIECNIVLSVLCLLSVTIYSNVLSNNDIINSTIVL